MDDETRCIPRSRPMFSLSSSARADMATDLAIPLIAEGGWPAVTLRGIAVAANVTPQAIAAWFPSVMAMRVAVAERYGQRWIHERGATARRRVLLSGAAGPAQVALALLPESWVERVFDGVWLTVVEAGRWDDTIRASVAAVDEAERDLVIELLVEAGSTDQVMTERNADRVLTVVRGLRAALVASDHMSVVSASEVIEGCLSGAT